MTQIPQVSFENRTYPISTKVKEFIENIEAIKESQIIPTTINQIEKKS